MVFSAWVLHVDGYTLPQLHSLAIYCLYRHYGLSQWDCKPKYALFYSYKVTLIMEFYCSDQKKKKKTAEPFPAMAPCLALLHLLDQLAYMVSEIKKVHPSWFCRTPNTPVSWRPNHDSAWQSPKTMSVGSFLASDF